MHIFIEFNKKAGKNDKMRGLSNILLLLRDEFHNFNKTGARKFDPIYHMT